MIWHLVPHHRRRHVETQILLRLVGIHTRKVVVVIASSRSPQTVLKFLRLHPSSLNITVNSLPNSQQNLTQFGIKSSSLPKFPEKIVDVIKFSHNFLEIFLALVISSLVPLVQIITDLSDCFGLMIDRLGFLIESFDKFISP